MNYLGHNVTCFLLAAETQNFSKAAQQLGITQQAVSKTISQLEKELGIALFVRSHRSVQLTEAGRQCQALFTNTLRQLQAICTQNAAQEEQLAFGYQNYMELTSLLSSAIARFRESVPNANIVFECYSPAGLLNELESERLSMIMICRRFLQRKNQLQTAFIMKLPLLLMASGKYLKPGEPPEALYSAPFIIDRLENESPDDIEARIQREVKNCKLSPKRVIVVPNRDSAYTAVETGQGVLICTSASRYLSQRGVQFYDTGATDDLICCWKKSCPTPLPGEFAHLLQTVCEERQNTSE